MASIQAAAAPLTTVDPAFCDTRDLEPLKEIVGDARLVGLGETAHWSSELTRLRDRVTRFLVTELGFSTFALESGLPEGFMVDRWVRGGAGELPAVARDGISYGFGRCTETHDQLRWMREHNRVGGQVSFVGVDVPGACTDPGPGVAACLDRLPPRPGDDALRHDARLAGGPVAPRPDASGTASVPAGLREKITELLDRAGEAGDDVAVQCVRGTLTVVEFLEHGLYPAPGRNLRNEVMAENLRWLLDRDPRARILVGAHNVHLQRNPSFDGTAPIGALLHDELGHDMVLIGNTRSSVAVPTIDPSAPADGRYTLVADDSSPAPAHTLDALLDSAGPLHLTDLRGLDRGLLDGVTAMQGAFGLDVDLDPHHAFDAVIHTRAVTPAHGTHD